MAENLLAALTNRALLSDGAMGTQLIAAGLEQGACCEAWNLTHPDRVEAIQRRYVEAGSDCLITNTFGGCRLALDRHGLGDKTVAINQAAVAIARRALPGFVLGDIGPFGGIMEPYGDVKPRQVAEAFDEQARALAESDVDAIIVETQTSLEELGLAVDAARKAGANCIIGSMSFDGKPDGNSFRTMMGVSPDQAARFMQERGVHILSLNCGSNIDMVQTSKIVRAYREVSSLPIMAQPNAGTPELENGKVVYRERPEHMAQGVSSLLKQDVRIIGGCCGSTPDHIRAMRKAMEDY